MRKAAQVALIALALPVSAAAQGVDAHGLVPPAGTGAVSEPLLGWSGSVAPKGTGAAALTLEYGRDPLVHYLDAGGKVQRTPLLGAFGVANLGARYAVSDRVGLALTAPVVLASGGQPGGGPTTGDFHLALPIGLVDLEGSGLSVAAIPLLRLPTGAGGRYFGDAGFGWAAIGALSATPGPLLLDGSIGLEGRTVASFENLSGGMGLQGAASLGWSVSERLAVRAETRFRTQANPVPGAGSPVELLLTARGATGDGLTWSAGLGRGLNAGVGAASARVFAGVGYRFGGKAAPEAVVEGGAFALQVVGPDGTVAGASVWEGDERIGQSDPTGRLVLPEEPRWRKGVEVRAPGYATVAISRRDVDAAEHTVALEYVPVSVTIPVRDQEGNPVQAEVRLEGADAPIPLDADGVLRTSLPPGRYTLTFEADGLGAQQRTVVIEPGRMGAVEAEVLLAPEDAGDATVVLAITDEDGVAVEGARVLVDGRPVGTTAAGGVLAVSGLGDGDHTVSIAAETFQEIDRREVLVPGDRRELAVTLEREIGTVQVRVRGPDGPVDDAVVRFFGPSRLPPTALGPDGDRKLVVRPGTWQVLVTSARYGVQEREVVVPPDSNDLVVVEVVLLPAEDGAAELAIRVVDPSGDPVVGAEVRLDGRSVGTTSTGGALELAGLLPGPRRLEVEGERFRPLPPVDLLLIEGLQERILTLEWLPGTVRLVTRSPDGPVGDATARFAGPGSVPPQPVGARGEAWLQLDPGDWQVLVVSPSYGMQQRDVVVPEDAIDLIEVDVVLNPGEGGLADLNLRVVDPDGLPVDGATIRLDGTRLGATSTGGTARLEELSTGRRTLEVQADRYAPRKVPLLLTRGSLDFEVKLAWAPGATRVTVVSADGVPVQDAVVRFAGPASVPPARVDREGRRLVTLSPGTWQVLVASPSYGLRQRSLEIPADAAGLQELTVELQPLAAGRAELLVRVVDPEGRPVEGATVAVGGEARGETTAGGLLLLGDLEPKPLDLLVMAPHFGDAALRRVPLEEGSNERFVRMQWVPTPVRVEVSDAEGRPVDAEVRFDGPAEVSGGRTGADGAETFDLTPGSWRILASSSELGVKSVSLEVRPGQRAADVALALEAARVGMTADEVVIKEQVLFEVARAELQAESEAVLAEVANTLLATPGIVKVEVQGHTDATGDVAYNLELSQRRAEAVLADLVRRGVAPERLVARGYGPTRPIASNGDEQGRALNRRVQFEIREVASE